MNTVIIEKINQLINEEKWTRTTIDNYSMGHFEHSPQGQDGYFIGIGQRAAD